MNRTPHQRAHASQMRVREASVANKCSDSYICLQTSGNREAIADRFLAAPTIKQLPGLCGGNLLKLAKAFHITYNRIMNKFETAFIELDPSYDPERLEGSSELSSEKLSETTTTDTPVAHVDIPEYRFDTSVNPFAYNTKDAQSVGNIAEAIDIALESNFSVNNIIIRGVQSGNHDIARKQLIESILQNGSDLYRSPDKSLEIHAKEYSQGIVLDIMGGFHVWKPKCEERPQYPVDIWMIFDKEAFDNIEYMHPRHKVIARDKWKLKNSDQGGLKGILVVN